MGAMVEIMQGYYTGTVSSRSVVTGKRKTKPDKLSESKWKKSNYCPLFLVLLTTMHGSSKWHLMIMVWNPKDAALDETGSGALFVFWWLLPSLTWTNKFVTTHFWGPSPVIIVDGENMHQIYCDRCQTFYIHRWRWFVVKHISSELSIFNQYACCKLSVQRAHLHVRDHLPILHWGGVSYDLICVIIIWETGVGTLTWTLPPC
jgi:hypothetical protein